MKLSVIRTHRNQSGIITFLFLAALSIAPAQSTSFAKENPHTDLDTVAGSKTCLDCHENTARDIAETVHYQFKGTSRQGVNGAEISGGVLAGYTPYAGGSGAGNWLYQVAPADPAKPSQIRGCAICHPGFGAMPSPKVGTADINNVDCLFCHGEGYQRSAQKVNGRWQFVANPGQDFVAMTRKAGKPTAEMCQRCHAAAGGGTNHMDGVVPTADSDVHFSMGMACVECHPTTKHRIAGGGDLKALEPVTTKVACSNCHTLAPHKADSKNEEKIRNAAVFNSHAQKIACQTCHIPAIASDLSQPTVIERDWTKPALNPATGLYEPTDKLATMVKAEYRWWNGTFTSEGEPFGAHRDGQSKITPWKKTKYVIAVDASSGQPLNLNGEIYATTGDINQAIRKGVAESKQPYSGKWRAQEVTTYYLLNHQVAPKDKAFRCANCHNPNGVMDLKALRPAKRRPGAQQ